MCVCVFQYWVFRFSTVVSLTDVNLSLVGERECACVCVCLCVCANIECFGSPQLSVRLT